MSGTAKLYPDAELNPTKAELAQNFASIKDLQGSARLVDPEGEVGIEFHFGLDDSGRLIQLPVTYRSAELSEQATLTTLEHSELGKRWVSSGLSDPVAVTQIIRTIVQGDDGAEFSDGPGPQFLIRGSGEQPEAEVVDAQIAEATRQRAVGTVTVDGKVLSYRLRISALPVPARSASTDYGTSRLHLTAVPAQDPEATPVIIAELMLSDGLG